DLLLRKRPAHFIQYAIFKSDGLPSLFVKKHRFCHCNPSSALPWKADKGAKKIDVVEASIFYFGMQSERSILMATQRKNRMHLIAAQRTQDKIDFRPKSRIFLNPAFA